MSVDVVALQQELARLRSIEADAAALRLAFEKAAQAYFMAMKGKVREEWKEEPKAVWQSLYEAVRDRQAGMALLAEIQRLRPCQQDLPRLHALESESLTRTARMVKFLTQHFPEEVESRDMNSHTSIDDLVEDLLYRLWRWEH